MRGTKGSQTEDKENRGAKQNKAAGEGLRLVLETKGSQTENTGNSSAKKTKLLEKPETSARNEGKSVGRQRKPRRKTKQSR